MTSLNSNAEIEKEFLEIEKAKKSLLAYCRLQNPKYIAPAHVITIARALNDVMKGKCKRLIVCMPPRHGKSMTSTQYFPAWYLGHYPDRYVIISTYGQNLANDFGRKVRDQISDVAFKKIFPNCQMNNDTMAAHRFTTSMKGEFFAVGAGGAITGRGAHLLLIDDIFKNRQEADSVTIRESRIEWYKSVAYTRLMTDGSVVIVTTRWHEEDLVGYVLKHHAHENWAVINLPAISNEGKALWPERYPIATLEKTKQTTGEYDWHCLYQQNPIPREGNIFKLDWMVSGIESEYAAYFMAIDPAISEETINDETSITVVGIGYGERPKVDEIETIHGHWGFEDQINHIKAIYEKYGKKMELIGVERVAYQKALAQVLHKMGLPIVELPADTDKVRRAFAITHLFTQGRVRINTPELKEQLLRFRGKDGEKNDLVDSFVHSVKMVLDYSSERYDKEVDEFYGLDPKTDGASIIFWKSHREENERKEGFSDYFKKII